MGEPKIIVRRQVAETDTTANGNTVLIAAQGANTSIRINHIYAILLTNTANQIISFNEGGTGEFFKRPFASIGSLINVGINPPWIVETNTAFQINVSLTSSAVHASVLYDVEDRS